LHRTVEESSLHDAAAIPKIHFGFRRILPKDSAFGQTATSEFKRRSVWFWQ